MSKFYSLLFLFLLLSPSYAQQEENSQLPDTTLFFEAEDFQIEGEGWQARQNAQTRRASLGKALNGASGDGKSTAHQSVEIPRAGIWRIWVRYMEHSNFLGPFDVDLLSGEDVIASQSFGLTAKPEVANWEYAWDSFDVELSVGKYLLRLRKHEEKNSSGYARNVDCFLLTTDLEEKPDHIPYGPQTWMRTTLGNGYEKPLYIHIFADHFRSPWYQHYAISQDGLEQGLRPSRKEAFFSNSEKTPWINITEMIYQDSGALLSVSPAYTYHERAEKFKAVIEFANQPEDSAIVRRLEADYMPSTIRVIVPPNLEDKENIAKLQFDRDLAQSFGRIADEQRWPQIGKKPSRFPFFVAASGMNPKTVDEQVMERELKTLSYFGFNGIGNESAFEKYGYLHKYIGGVGWFTKGSYSAPDTEKIRERAASLYKSQIESGIKAEEIAYAMVMDEPTGESSALLAKDAASIKGFRDWIRSKKLTPSDLKVLSWDEVKPIVETERDKFPALHYYTQQYRTVALGNFISLQKKLLHENWKAEFPVNVNFSDGAVYYGNFYGQGVDYFTLLHETDQNAIWSEDWSNGASTYQNATFNVELMRAAARKNGQHLGHYLIAYAGRTGIDIRLKAVSEVARGIKAFKSFAYGPRWATHEGSPWQTAPNIWQDHASVIREIGAVEDMLMTAQPQKAEVALLYSSATDIWAYRKNLAAGFDRMHTWLALSHAQIPVDIIHESEVAEGLLDQYKICYFSGSHITEGAAEELSKWVRAGGTLILTAGAGQFNEYNEPLHTLDGLLSYQRLPVSTLQNYSASGRHLSSLQPKDKVTTAQGEIEVLSLKQTFESVAPGPLVRIEAQYSDGTPASVRSTVDKGSVITQGYLPALDYIRRAIIAKDGVQQRARELDENQGIPGSEDVVPLELNEKSYNPWEYPTDVREHILAPIREREIETPIVSNTALVDAVYMQSPKGVVIPIANYTLSPIKDLQLEITVPKSVKEVHSVHQGKLTLKKTAANKILVSFPLDYTDFLTVDFN